MSSFLEKIEDLIGVVNNTTLITDSIQQVGEEIIGIAPVEKLNNISLTIAVPAEADTENPSVGVGVHDKRVLGASKSGYKARIVSSEEKTRYLDTSSIYRASDTTPVYYILNDTLFVIGSNGLETSGTLRFVPKTPVSAADLAPIDSGDSATYGFPKEAERLLVLGAACRCLQKLLTDSRASLPADISAPVLIEMSTVSLPTFSTPNNFLLPAVPAGVNVDLSSIGDAPTYTTPVLGIIDTPSITDLNISVDIPVLPPEPDFSAISMSDYTINTFESYSASASGSAGSHASSVSIDDADWADMLNGLTPPTYVKPTVTSSAFPSGDVDWTMPTIPVAPSVDWSIIVQTVQEILLPAGIVLPSIDIDEPDTTTWNFPSPPVQPDLDFSGITQSISDITLPPGIVMPTFAFDSPAAVTWDFPGVPVTPTIDYGDLESWITAEDPEMAQVRINAIQATISSHQGASTAYQTQVNSIVARNQGIISTWGDEWKTKAQVYQTELNSLVSAFQGESQGKQAIVQAQVNARNSQVEEVLTKARSIVQMYQAKISVYQAEYNGIIQQNSAIISTWSNEWQTRMGKFTSELNALVKKYATEAEGTGKQSQAQIAIRGQQLQEASERAKTEVSIYQGEMQAYQTEVQAIAQKNAGVATNWQKENAGQLQQYQLDIQNELNRFNKDNAAYQKESDARLLWYQSQARKGTTTTPAGSSMAGRSSKGEAQASSTQNVAESQLNFQKDLQDYTMKLGLFNAALKRYQGDVSKVIQEYSTNFQKELGIWNTEVRSNLQSYGSEVQAETAETSSAMAVYTSKIQQALQTYQLETGNDLSLYGASIKGAVQEYTSDLQKKSSLFNTSLQKYQAELGTVTANNQSSITKYRSDVQNYSAKLQKYGADYQWKHGQLGQLYREYQLGLQLFMTGRIDMRNPEQQRRR